MAVALALIAFLLVVLFVGEYPSLVAPASVVFSGLGVFLASLWVDRRREGRNRRGLLLEVEKEIHDNNQRLGMRSSPFVGYYPLRRDMLELAIRHRSRYFAERNHLNHSLDLVHRYIRGGEQAWLFFRDVTLERVPTRIAEQFSENTVEEYMNLQHIVFPLSCQYAVSEIAAELGEDAEVLLGAGWAALALQFVHAWEEGQDPNPLLGETELVVLNQAVGLIRQVAESVLAGTFTVEWFRSLLRSELPLVDWFMR